MPELPEVETIKQDLAKKILGKRITQIDIGPPRIIRKQGSAREIKQAAEGRLIKNVARRGKFLLFHLDSENTMVLHLGMTGQLLFFSSETPPAHDKHTHVIFRFDDGSMLFFRDIRKFGQLFIVPRNRLNKELDLGPEPLSSSFQKRHLTYIMSRTTGIKQLLLDQKRLAGIGNIYADEVLFDACIHPLRPANSLTEQEIEHLFVSLQTVLREAIELRGTSISDYIDVSGKKGQMQNKHRVYQKTGEPCPRCSAAVQRIKVAGRGTHFCPNCQRI